MTHPEFKDGSCLWLGALDPHPNPPPFQARHCAVLDRQRGRAEGSYGGRDALHPFPRNDLPPSPLTSESSRLHRLCGEGGRGLGLVLFWIRAMRD